MGANQTGLCPQKRRGPGRGKQGAQGERPRDKRPGTGLPAWELSAHGLRGGPPGRCSAHGSPHTQADTPRSPPPLHLSGVLPFRGRSVIAVLMSTAPRSAAHEVSIKCHRGAIKPSTPAPAAVTCAHEESVSLPSQAQRRESTCKQHVLS